MEMKLTKVVVFKIEGERDHRMGPALSTDTEATVLERLKRVFGNENIKIIELT